MKWMIWMKILLAIVLIAGLVVQAQQTSAPSVRDGYRRSPNDPAIQTQMVAQWFTMAIGKQQAEVLAETAPALTAATDPKHRLDILFVRARAGILLPGSIDKAPALVEEFVKAAPQDDRSAELLFRLAKVQPDAARQSVVYRRATVEYSASYWGIMSKGALTQMASIGKPFDLAFTDAVSGKPVSIQRDMKGKLVVVYFWATWCSDCTAELPQMKQLHATYKDKGVEFVGVSLDEPEAAGGLTKLKDYVATNAIPWPQYFQGGDKQRSEFSAGWGVSATPTVFLIDREGKLANTAAKGQLEKLIPEMLLKPVG